MSLKNVKRDEQGKLIYDLCPPHLARYQLLSGMIFIFDVLKCTECKPVEEKFNAK